MGIFSACHDNTSANINIKNIVNQTPGYFKTIKQPEIICSTEQYDFLKSLDETERLFELECYEEQSELNNRPFDLIKRFDKIRKNLALIEQTNVNVNNRFIAIKQRESSINTRISNDNLREKNKTKALKLTYPNLINKMAPVTLNSIDISQNYNQINKLITDINVTIENKAQGKICSFNLIDSKSLQIVEEIEAIQLLQNSVNEKLAKIEETFTDKEIMLNNRENQLTILGY